ncbi:Sec-independent protein translocase protein TatA [Agromyces rhizosphaerae]|uniref:Sec-independent protein translocase protein TatA n=1 Tax=Agromyces rhizosphaerae TaxID=88374 RepID=A0A9W6CY68_9MICO|nr:Sec-independent protein translocase subunit TatA [Agromyces rhizosphaerae]GLI28924.1 Sec-independent protein translocase protein TatA [Agromyces rhizosphaerae]
MFANLTGWHFLIILVVILLLFGAPRLPALARSLGQSMKILKSEVRQDGDDADGTEAKAKSDQSGTAEQAADESATKRTDSGTSS